MQDDDMALREELHRAWRAVMKGAVERGYPEQAVLETMASCAHHEFSKVFGVSAAASYLQLLAAELRNSEHAASVSLIKGLETTLTDEQDADLGWENNDALF